MTDNLQTSQNNITPLTVYSRCVTFLVETYKHTHVVDQDTTQGLSALLSASTVPRFVRISTSKGIVLLNTAQITEITADETRAKLFEEYAKKEDFAGLDVRLFKEQLAAPTDDE